MLSDVRLFQLAVRPAHAIAFKLLFVIKWGTVEPHVTRSFIKKYLNDHYFSWVALLCYAGIAKTNNALESFNALIAKLIEDKKRVTLRRFLGDVLLFVKYLARQAIVTPFPRDSLDILAKQPDGKSVVRPQIPKHVEALPGKKRKGTWQL